VRFENATFMEKTFNIKHGTTFFTGIQKVFDLSENGINIFIKFMINFLSVKLFLNWYINLLSLGLRDQ